MSCEFESHSLHKSAAIAQLVEHDLAKVGVASSSLVCRSNVLLSSCCPTSHNCFFVCIIMKILPTLALSLVSVVSLQAQTRHTVRGYITDQSSKETLIGATILDLKSGKGAITNEYGFYSITLPDGPIEIRTGYVGYKPVVKSFKLTADTIINIDVPLAEELSEVTIYGNREILGVKGSQMSAVDIPIEQIKSVPAMFGETDVLKALQLLAGVQAGTEATAGLYVRGGNPDENLLLLDGVPVYNVNHMFGMFSVFNPDAIMNKFHGNASIGIISSKFSVEGPIKEGKTSFIISGRRTYSDLILNAALKLNDLMNYANTDDLNMGYYFYDLNIKVNHKFNDTDRLYVSWYSGDDDIYFKYKSADGAYKQKTLRLRQNGRTIDAVVYDMCSDSDCNGCCTQNAGDLGFLIDIESYSCKRFTTNGDCDGVVEWTCLDCD